MDVMVSGHFKGGRIHVWIDIFNLNSFLFRRWETLARVCAGSADFVISIFFCELAGEPVSHPARQRQLLRCCGCVGCLLDAADVRALAERWAIATTRDYIVNN